MPIPDAKRAIITAEKICDYLLNLEHPDGGPKAIWFYTLGYARDKWQRLADDLMAIARDCNDFHTETTRFGVKYKATGWVRCPNQRPGKIVTIWIVEDDDPPRLVTAYPDEDK